MAMFPFNADEDEEWDDLDLSDITSNIFLRTSMKKNNLNAQGKDKGTGGKACWKGYKRVGANGCAKMKNYKGKK